MQLMTYGAVKTDINPQTLKDGSICAALSDPAIEFLLENGEIYYARPGDIVFDQGDPGVPDLDEVGAGRPRHLHPVLERAERDGVRVDLRDRRDRERKRSGAGPGRDRAEREDAQHDASEQKTPRRREARLDRNE